MPQCVVRYSPDVARQAAAHFLHQRYLTRFGISQIVSAVLMVGLVAFFLYLGNQDIAVGALGMLLVMNLATQLMTVALLPSRTAQIVQALDPPSGTVTTDGDGFTIAEGKNVTSFRWSQCRYIWLQPEYIVFGLSFFRPVHIPADGMSEEVRLEFQKRASPTVGA